VEAAMKIPVDLHSIKPAAVRRLAEMLWPGKGCEPLSVPLAACVRDLQGQIDAIVDAGGEGVIAVELAALSDEDLRRLGLRLRCAGDALFDLRPGRDKPFLQLLTGLRVACANDEILRQVGRGELHLVNGNQPEDDLDEA
jgi:hypothetical protein